MTALTQSADVQGEEIGHARVMVHRFEMAAATHPVDGPLTDRQKSELSNLAHWRRRLANITGHNGRGGEDGR